MSNRVFVTGCGMISSIGNNFGAMEEAVFSGKSGIGPISILDTHHKGRLIAGEVRHTDTELAEMAGIALINGLTRTTLLGLIAAKEAVASAGLTDLKELSLISGTTVGGMVSTEKYYPDFLSNDSKNEFIESHDCGDSAERIAGFLGIGGNYTTINTACSSAANAIMLGVRLIKNGQVERVLAGGVDALSKFTLNGFNTLMIVDTEPCKPFDDQRNGLNLGEGAGFLLLESEKVVGDKEVLCEIKGYGNANDAFHQTALSPEGRGAYLAMKSALDAAGLSVYDIDYINAHGTATQNNDLAEGMAIQQLFSDNVPNFSSTKPMIGHLLGASGAIEAGICILAMRKGFIPTNLNFKTQMKELKIKPVTTMVTNIDIRHAMSNSFGFGGNNTTLIFSKI
jgi:3-oxoacyl-[acyl-carrier-protein] synthase II